MDATVVSMADTLDLNSVASCQWSRGGYNEAIFTCAMRTEGLAAARMQSVTVNDREQKI
jgi:hypothetical protein